MPDPSTQLRWKITGSLVGSGLLSWLSALALTRVGATALQLPEGAEIAAVETVVE